MLYVYACNYVRSYIVIFVCVYILYLSGKDGRLPEHNNQSINQSILHTHAHTTNDYVYTYHRLVVVSNRLLKVKLSMIYSFIYTDVKIMQKC